MKNDQSDPLGFLYESRENDLIKSLGDRYKPPARFEYAVEALVADLEPISDGKRAQVFEERWPATFYSVKVLDETGKVLHVLSTGSGDECGELAGLMAVAISEGMLGVDTRDLK